MNQCNKQMSRSCIFSNDPRIPIGKIVITTTGGKVKIKKNLGRAGLLHIKSYMYAVKPIK